MEDLCCVPIAITFPMWPVDDSFYSAVSLFLK